MTVQVKYPDVLDKAVQAGIFTQLGFDHGIIVRVFDGQVTNKVKNNNSSEITMPYNDGTAIILPISIDSSKYYFTCTHLHS